MRKFAYVVSILVVSLCVGCGSLEHYFSPEATQAWIAGEMTPLTDRTARSEDPQVFDAASNTVKLFGASNETVSFQIVVDTGAAQMDGVRVEFSPLGGAKGKKIEPANIRAFRMLPVKVTEFPAWYLRLTAEPPQPMSVYDALCPVEARQGGQPYRLGPNERLAIWVDLYVPRTTPAGRYAGTLAIRSKTNQAWEGKLSLDVYDFVLPDARPLASVGGFDYETLLGTLIRRDGKPFVPPHLDRKNPLVREGLSYIRELMVLGHEHRLDLFEKRMHPLMKTDMFGSVRLDWEDYDAIVGPYLSGEAFDDRIGNPAWPIPFHQHWPELSNYGPGSEEIYAATTGQLLAQSRQHFKNLNFTDQIFAWPFRGPVEGASYVRHAKMARLLRAADSETPILCELPVVPPELTTWQPPVDFAKLADIQAPPAQWLNPEKAARPARPENPLVGVWLAPGQVPYLPSLGIIASPADVRAIPWFAMKYGCTGLFLNEVLNWKGDLLTTPAGAETRLFYPGPAVHSTGVLASVRLKRLRRGLQDLAYLWILRQKEHTGMANSILNTMTRYGALAAAGDHYLDPRLDGWVPDGATWEMARRILAEEVQVALGLAAPNSQQLIAQRVAWQSLEEKSHCIRVEQVRSVVAPAPVFPASGPATTPAAEKLRATVLLDLYNEYARDVDVSVKMDLLPPGWQAVEGYANVPSFPASSRKTVVLTAEASYVPADNNTARLLLPVSITTDMKARKALAVAIPFLKAGHANTPPRIDGRLDDWPNRTGNVAGGFRMIGRRGEVNEGCPKRATAVTAMFDDQNLYLALRCEEPNLAGMKVNASNLVHYEQLMACGEDLVEVILDPGASAQGPEQLYHILVKPGGATLAERGISCDPPLGKSQPWPVAMQVAVGKENNAWTVEMAIPLSAFGPAGKQRFWGVNFARFAYQGNESSSWSGAPRYYYDPKNLGTMFINTAARP